jgi:large subunit ribosomal protein L3
MKVSLLGKKLGMTRVFTDDGSAVAVTVIELEPSVVTALKSKDTDGYDAIQLGFGSVKEKKVKKAQKGFFAKAKVELRKKLYEVRLDTAVDSLAVGDSLGVDNFEAGDFVDIEGTSIGKGFQGVMKRHHFSGGRASHGDKTGRRGGSIGQSAYPSRTFKNMKNPGRMGNEQVTTQNLKILKVDSENNVIVVQGSVPGAKNNIVRVSLALKKAKESDLKVIKAEREEKENPPSQESVQNASAETAVAEPENASANEPIEATVESNDSSEEQTKQEDK